MSKIKLNVLGKCPYCGAPNTKKINETEYLCNHCGQKSFIEKELHTYDSSNLNLKDIQKLKKITPKNLADIYRVRNNVSLKLKNHV